MMLKAILLAALIAGVPAATWAVQPDEMLKDPALEARARTISEGLRCLVCQNQSIDDSAAPLARDLRLLVRERLKVGDTDGQVRDYLVARYGDFVLLKPPFQADTLLLWGLPFAVLLIGGGALLLRRPARRPAPTPLSAEEQARIAALVDDPRP
jgi:cytochrome c-type biogenesis protein CcmH